MRSLSADLLGLVDDTGQEQAVFVGHDWGALIVWDLIRLHPDRVRGVAGVSVPFIDWPAPPLDIFRQRFGDRFFYIVYFQEVGPAERELEADVRRTMHNVLWSASAAERCPASATSPSASRRLTTRYRLPGSSWISRVRPSG